MKMMFGAALAAAFAFAPATAFALDRVEGTVQRVDTTAFVFTIKVSGAAKRQMSFKLQPDTFDDLALDVNDRLSVDYDKAECGSAPDCIPTAAKVERKS